MADEVRRTLAENYGVYRDALFNAAVEQKYVKAKDRRAWLLGWNSAMFMLTEHVVAMAGGKIQVVRQERDVPLQMRLGDDRE